MANDALALVELGSVARGLKALDALVKKAPVTLLEANLVEPGHYLLLFVGEVAAVQESFAEALAVSEGAVLDSLLLPFAHPDLLAGLQGAETPADADSLDTLGLVEARTVAATLGACDRCLKDADVKLVGLRVAGGLGGRGWFALCGAQHDVEAGLDVARGSLGDAAHAIELIPRPHEEMVPWLLRRAPFRLGGPGGP